MNLAFCVVTKKILYENTLVLHDSAQAKLPECEHRHQLSIAERRTSTRSLGVDIGDNVSLVCTISMSIRTVQADKTPWP